eukprot:1181838-Prorocentrum_minimum.AAC.4
MPVQHFLYAQGLCCQSGILDECQICDGDGSSCAVRVTVSLSAPTDVTSGLDQTDSEEYQAFAESFTRQMALLMNLLPAQIKICCTHLLLRASKVLSNRHL